MRNFHLISTNFTNKSASGFEEIYVFSAFHFMLKVELASTYARCSNTDNAFVSWATVYKEIWSFLKKLSDFYAQRRAWDFCLFTLKVWWESISESHFDCSEAAPSPHWTMQFNWHERNELKSHHLVKIFHPESKQWRWNCPIWCLLSRFIAWDNQMNCGLEWNLFCWGIWIIWASIGFFRFLAWLILWLSVDDGTNDNRDAVNLSCPHLS